MEVVSVDSMLSSSVPQHIKDYLYTGVNMYTIPTAYAWHDHSARHNPSKETAELCIAHPFPLLLQPFSDANWLPSVAAIIIWILRTRHFRDLKLAPM
jgi:hypothetical protein